MLSVSSEVGRLRRVLVHEPGPEVDRMVPSMMEELLFDDILYGERAREEHGRLRRVLQLLGVEVVETRGLLIETLADPQARAWLMEALIDELPPALAERLAALAPEALADELVCGVRDAGGEAGDALYELAPLPNWCFQRDPQVVLGSGLVCCSMAAGARHREALLSRALTRFNPLFAGATFRVDPLTGGGLPGPDRPCLEGGDVLVLSPDVIAVGCSQRTNRRGVRALTRCLHRLEGGPRWLVVAELPRRRAFMHLDTLITPLDRDLCLVYPPVIRGHGRLAASVYTLDLHAETPHAVAEGSLLATLASHGVEMAPVACGGDDPLIQEREQWTDGANAFAVAPGVILMYDRNIGTAAQLERAGFELVKADDLLLGRAEVDLDAGRRVCILLASHELSRARGGPHCLTHPLERDPLA